LKKLEELSPAEWEQLCFACGKCCVYKLEDEETGKIYWTNVACRYLDITTHRCQVYKDRFTKQSDCERLYPEFVKKTKILPKTCAYRQVAEGRPPVLPNKPCLAARGFILEQDMPPGTDLSDHVVWHDDF
jgi:uncharacterized cysteine cluster protein YcgN (CxxCxxCC family)